MFRAYEQSMAKAGEVYAPEPDSMYLKMVEMDSGFPWFHLCLHVKADDGVYRLQVMPCGHQEFELFMTGIQFEDRVKSIDVQVMLPPHMTGRGRWTLELLESLHEVVEADSKSSRFYALASGAVYREGDGESVDLDEASTARIIYQSRHRSHVLS
ncbi:hypothetical protein BWR15_15510 [Pseudomonas sp. T]|nr:hypothetical protein BWR15_15510 [Pseudomonas sp. T]